MLIQNQKTYLFRSIFNFERHRNYILHFFDKNQIIIELKQGQALCLVFVFYKFIYLIYEIINK